VAHQLKIDPPDSGLSHPQLISPGQAVALCKAAEDAGFAQDSRIVNSDGASLGAYDGFRV
jgi:predicted Zn-dependent protease